MKLSQYSRSQTLVPLIRDQAVMAKMLARTAGMDTRTVEMMPMRAYDNAQKGNASGSLHRHTQAAPIPQCHAHAAIAPVCSVVRHTCM